MEPFRSSDASTQTRTPCLYIITRQASPSTLYKCKDQNYRKQSLWFALLHFRVHSVFVFTGSPIAPCQRHFNQMCNWLPRKKMGPVCSTSKLETLCKMWRWRSWEKDPTIRSRTWYWNSMLHTVLETLESQPELNILSRGGGMTLSANHILLNAFDRELIFMTFRKADPHSWNRKGCWRLSADGVAFFVRSDWMQSSSTQPGEFINH